MLPAALAAVVLALTALLLPGAPRRRVMLALLSAAIGFGWYAAASAARLTPAEAVPDELQTLAGRVTEYPAAYEHSCGLTVLLTSPDVPHCRARLYVSDAEAAALRPGDEITAEVRLRASTHHYGAETDAYTSKGIYLIGNVKEGSLTHTGVWAHSRLYWPKTVARALKTSAQAAFPADVLPFAQAFMLGDKTALYAQNLDIPLSTTGIMHTVAVSGLHLAFLLGIFAPLYRKPAHDRYHRSAADDRVHGHGGRIKNILKIEIDLMFLRLFRSWKKRYETQVLV